jgi:hypothetical protein
LNVAPHDHTGTLAYCRHAHAQPRIRGFYRISMLYMFLTLLASTFATLH